MIPKEMSVEGMAEVISHEAIVTGPYLDSVGVVTDGIGNTKAAGDHDPARLPFGSVIPIEEILLTFRNNARRFERRTTKALTIHTTQTEYDAFCSFDFNTGGIDRAQLVKSHNAGDKATCAAQFMNWVKPIEITGRRMKEKELYARGIYASNGTALVCPASNSGKPLYSKGKNINMIPIIRQLKKANDSDSQADKHKTNTIAATTTGVSAGGASTIPVGQPTELTPEMITALAPNLKYLVIAIAVAGIACAIYSALQMIRKRQRATVLTRSAAAMVQNRVEVQGG